MIKLKKRYEKLVEANLPNSEAVAKKYGHKELIKLYYNENKYSPSPKVKEAIKINSPNIYPEYKEPKLIKNLADIFKISQDHFYFANGSDAILDHIPTLFADIEKNDNIILPNLTFGRIETTALVNGIEVKKIPLTEGKIDLDKTLEAIDENTAIIYVVNPNMPTGKINSHNELVSFLQKVPSHILVVIDEAYGEYAFGIEKCYEQDKQLIEEFDNIIITHTLSKLYALGAFRVGYMIARPYITALFRKSYQYLPVNKYSLQAAMAAISDREYYNNIIDIINGEKDKYYKLLDELKIKYYKSYGNFIYVLVPDNKKFEEFLVSKYAVLIRSVKNNAIRITVGTIDENKLVLKALKEYYA